MNFGIIGCGYIAKKSFIPAIIKSSNANLSMIYTRSSDKQKMLEDEFKCKVELNLNKILSSDQIDAVYIATPPATHENYILKAAKNKKHILCEKPLTTNYNNAEKIIKICKKYNVALLEGFMYQFHPQHDFVNGMIKEKVLGEPIVFQANFGFPPMNKNNYRYNANLGGGALLDAGVYTLHSARKIFNKEPINSYALRTAYEGGVDISGSCMLDFGNNNSAFLSYGFDNYYQNNYSIWFNKGFIKVDRAFSIPNDMKAKITINQNNKEEVIKIDCYDQFLAQLEYFILNHNKKNITNNWINDIKNQYMLIDSILKFDK